MHTIKKISWEQFEESCRDITNQIKYSEQSFDMILGIIRGGLPIAARLSYLLNIPDVVGWNIKGYDSQGNSLKTRKAIHKLPKKLLENKKILITEDILDTGKTAEFIINYLRQCNISDYKIASVGYKNISKIKPDYSSLNFDDTSWILFPWEQDRVIIYEAFCLITKQSYIGQTRQTLEVRKYMHEVAARGGSNLHFHNALRKYGKDNFIWKTIESCTTEKELDTRERYWIKKLNTLEPHGYNSTTGGKHYKSSLRARKNNSLSHLGKVVWNKGIVEDQISGEKNGRSILTWESVYGIRSKWSTGKYTHKDLSKEYGINSVSIGYIIRNKSWIDPDYTPPTGIEEIHHLRPGENTKRCKFTWEDIRHIRQDYIAGISYKNLSKKYNTRKGYIYEIIMNRSWFDPIYHPPSKVINSV